jgi:hypothetical protein
VFDKVRSGYRHGYAMKVTANVRALDDKPENEMADTAGYSRPIDCPRA